ncbi:hypothetical protein BDV25DRAFT_168001 [Aspergillus avenaceus]|uniref:Polyketide synthase n=1 Tax=Aspergillus avenaceus TaxID=36643 RepID=A0A5N6U5Z5_ASPAV|nr:hypothetical protein BDV25DRAFT_168001 [Aspergillus avenaceus]
MSHRQNEPIAIVGMGCRFPGGSNNASKLWDLLRSPYDVSREIPPNRFNIDRFYHKDGTHHGTTNVRRSYFLDQDVDLFDTKFFAIPPGEAEVIDPQQRLLLEVVYEAVENAGLTLDGLAGSNTAVYVGLMCQDFFAIQAQDVNSLPTYAATGVAASNASSRVSYFFNWHGPSMTIDTACSSSLVGVHEAVQALRNGTSRVAVACGTNLMVSPLPYIMESNLGMLSPDGQSRMWDADANGYARGEGVASLVLKTLSSAIEDGDQIACVIREVGVNHDGRTKGLTMPSALAQASLIKATYAKAGLDPTTKSGRCQFFEAHGTGTPAGDPQEAEALSKAFFPPECEDFENEDNRLLVGSVKTVIGHTEGTAGIAGLMKACMALQHSTVPPNLLFSRLNPALKPFTKHLRIALSPQPWPKLPDGVPRRASVNSFGFGGTNSHAILESYDPSSSHNLTVLNGFHPPAACHIPVALSAASDQSLLSLLESMRGFLETRPDIELSGLAYTLSTKRSALPQRLALSAESKEQLLSELTAKIDASATDEDLGTSALPAAPAILGVFTGQGAQWATMGIKLITSIPMARRSLNHLEESLVTLPECHRPRWKLTDEISADSTSRVGEAALSQPLCTALQIVLVDLLRAAGVQFRAVVGHSSGEIGAAYAAGYLSSYDAIRIAYYRGYFAKLAAGPSAEKGAMMAVGTTFEDAKELCELDDFIGRLSVAAHNAPASVTLSGDLPAIAHAQAIFEEEKKFARTLKVDTAYHSVHMLRCVSPYLRALQNCNIQPLQPEHDAPVWFSSVHGGRRIDKQDSEHLAGQYWVDNMVQPVLFYSAINGCLASTEVNSLLEVGPHPALQSPATESILDATGQKLPYTGTLKRGKNDVEAFSDALGYIWEHFGPAGVNLGRFQKACDPNHGPVIVRDLPTYPWSHDRVLWAESRISKYFRTQGGCFHDLLGNQTADGPVEEWRWRNVLKPKELKWLSGHALQGQTVFPGTGYIALAMEAGMQIAGSAGLAVQSIDLLNLEIRKAIAINDSTGTELLVSMTNVTPLSVDTTSIKADFAAYSTVSKESGQLALNCSGHVRIAIGSEINYRFAKRDPPPTSLSTVDVDRFYQVLRDDLGYGYEGAFRGLTRISRKSGYSTATIQCHPFGEDETPLLFHPGMLDSALQGLNAAYSAPGDGRLWSIVAPTSCRRVTIIPELCGKSITNKVEIDCTITDPRDDFITGDVDVYSTNYEYRIIEIEGIKFSPFAAATAEDDRLMFQESFLALEKPDAEIVFGDRQSSAEEKRKGLDAERAAFFYLKNLHLSVSPEDRKTLPWYRQALISTAEKLYDYVKEGKHSFAPAVWIDDTKEMIVDLMDSYGDDADFNLTRAVGEHLLIPSVLNGETSILEYMTKDNYLDRYYIDAIGFGMLNDLIAGVMGQICTKFPRIDLLEIGAGTGGATQAALGRIGHTYSSYTYTDISSGFFERAAGEKFQAHAHKMIFKTLNIENDPASQGFSTNSYDVIIASNVLHATKSLKETLQHTRSLLKPGGYLILLEVIRTDVMRHGLVMGGLPGWWIGEQDGRYGGPSITLEEWDAVLRETGFGGIETNSPMPDPVVVPGSVMVAQAQNTQFDSLCAPLKLNNESGQGTLVIIGGISAIASQLEAQLRAFLIPHFADIIHVDHLDGITEESELPNGCHILSLTEAESNLFDGMDGSRWQKLQRMLGSAASVLWLLKGSRAANPHAGTTLGLFRTLFYELPGTLLQTLDVGAQTEALTDNCTTIAELMLQLRAMSMMVRTGELDKFLWSFEPELILENGKLHTVRVRPHDEQNRRYNSAKRPITCHKNIDSTTLDLERRERSYILRENHELSDFVGTPSGSDHCQSITLHVSCSFLCSLKTPAGYFFAALGTNAETGEKMLSFSDRNSSKITIPTSWTIGLDKDETEIVDAQYMSFIVADLMAQQILNIVPYTGTVLAYDPDPVVASLISRKLADMGRKALFITSRADAKLRRNWIYLHEHSSMRAVRAAIPDDVTLYIDVSEDSISDTAQQSLGSKIAASLSPICDKIVLPQLVARQASKLPRVAPDSITKLLQRVTGFASSMLNSVPDGAPLNMLPLTQILSPTSPPSPSSLVDWRPEHPVPVLVEPVFEREHLFRPDRTYWLAGLAGDLGRSLADSILSHGAKYVVLSSRNPKVDEDWVRLHEAKGATVVYISGDLTNYDSVKQTYANIVITLPPIGGVANGAMVLRDGSFVSLSFNDFQTVLRSKIDTTVNLDRVFSEEANEPLDWFMGFSSIVGTTGNPGQVAYSAGNCFMKALINQRRSRGLAGSVIDISRVIGVGYIERESSGRLTKEHQERLSSRSGALAMSEIDLHQLFAEAIICGRPHSGLNPEVISGLAPITTEEAKDVFWATNSRFGLLIREANSAAAVSDKTANVPVRKMLEAATTPQDVRKILLSAFKTKLRAAMFLSESDALSESTPLVDMGVDSLVGVEMRSWFLKELGVDVPVMKILGGASIAELIDGVFQDLSTKKEDQAQNSQQELIINGSAKGPVTDAPSDNTSVAGSVSDTPSEYILIHDNVNGLSNGVIGPKGEMGSQSNGVVKAVAAVA